MINNNNNNNNVVHFPLPDGAFPPCNHELDFGINQSISSTLNSISLVFSTRYTFVFLLDGFKCCNGLFFLRYLI